VELDVRLTQSAAAEVQRRLQASTIVSDKPMAAALVFCLDQGMGSAAEHVGPLAGFWDLGFYDVASLPQGCLFRVGAFDWAWEDIPTMRHLLGGTIDFSNGEWRVIRNDA